MSKLRLPLYPKFATKILQVERNTKYIAKFLFLYYHGLFHPSFFLKVKKQKNIAIFQVVHKFFIINFVADLFMVFND